MKGGHNTIKPEEIRKANTNMNQTDYSDYLGLSFRAYQKRLTGEQSNWKISELIAMSKYNNDIDIEYQGKSYKISIKEL